MKPIKYCLLTGLVLSLLGCGSSEPDSTTGAIVRTKAPGDITVQLNDLWNQQMASQSYVLEFTGTVSIPSSVFVVGGSFAGIPGQFLRARLVLQGGARICEFRATSSTAVVLTLQECTYQQNNILLNQGDVVELVNYDAPGLLLEAHVPIKE